MDWLKYIWMAAVQEQVAAAFIAQAGKSFGEALIILLIGSTLGVLAALSAWSLPGLFTRKVIKPQYIHLARMNGKWYHRLFTVLYRLSGQVRGRVAEFLASTKAPIMIIILLVAVPWPVPWLFHAVVAATRALKIKNGYLTILWCSIVRTVVTVSVTYGAKAAFF